MAWLASFTVDGAHRWSRGIPSMDALPGNDIDSVRGLAVVGGWLAVAGYIHGDVDFGGVVSPAIGTYDSFLAFYELDGQFVTHRRFGDPLVYALAADDDDGVYLVGRVDGPVDFGGGTITAAGSGVVAAFDAAGTH